MQSMSSTKSKVSDYEDGSSDVPGVQNEGARLESIFSFIVKMAPLQTVKNRLGIGNHMLMALQTQLFKITIDVEHPSEAIDPGRSVAGDKDDDALKDDEIVILRVWQQGDRSLKIGGKALKIGGHNQEKEWVEHCRYRLEEVTIEKLDDKHAKIQFGIGRELVPREVRFVDKYEAVKFQNVLQRVTRLEKERGKRQLEKYRSSQQHKSMESLNDTDRIHLLVEVVSISDLPKNRSVEPYVAIKMGGKVLHRTDYVSSETGSVIYTLKDGCFFLLDMPMLEFFSSTGGMAFLVKDKDSLALEGEVLGRAVVPLERIVDATGERDSYDILPVAEAEAEQQVDDIPGKLSVRIRRATSDDIQFMTSFRMSKNQEGVFSEETFLPVRSPQAGGGLRLQQKPARHGENLHRVKPFPDPKRPKETKWMTKSEVHQEAMKPSSHWVEAGSGALGKVYIEVIACHDLPIMDYTNITTNVAPDAFACIVFEDSIVNTDVIPSERSPRWMPWCRRAFSFNVAHPSSNILLGLFDWDPESSPVQVAMSMTSDVHDPIARVLINVSDAIPDTVYTITYPLFFGKSREHRQISRGTITIRLRKEIYDNRKALLAGVKPPLQTYVSVATENDFKVAHYTTEGDLNEEAYSLNMFTGYIEEIESYQVILDYLKPAVLSVLLWRCHYEVSVCGKKVILPLNSLTAFVWGILVTNNFNRFPSFAIFSVGWAMLVCNDQARQAPSPWQQARSYPPLLKALLLGTKVTAETIPVNEGAEAMEMYNTQLAEKAERRKREKEMEAEYKRRLKEELGHGEYDEDDAIVSTKQRITDSIVVNPLILPFKSTLYPIQKELRKRVLQLRIATSIVTWQERLYAFWITTISFFAALVCFWVPWAFILKWILRIAVWVLLGPWFAIIARYRFPETRDMTDDGWKEAVRNRIQTKRRQAIEASTKIQIRKENAVKGKALARWMYGRYHLRVPRFTEQLFPDVPLSSSFAEPYNPDTTSPIEISERVYGQELIGVMIPKREVQVDPSHTARARANIFMEAGLGSYFDDAYGWAQFLNVTKVTYMIGYGIAKGRVYAKKDGGDAQLVGYSTLMMASAGWGMGTTLTSQIIFFQDEDAYKRFSRGNYEIEAGAKVTTMSYSADCTVGTTGLSAFNFIAKKAKADDKKRYFRGMATFVLSPKVGMLADASVVGQRFTFESV